MAVLPFYLNQISGRFWRNDIAFQNKVKCLIVPKFSINFDLNNWNQKVLYIIIDKALFYLKSTLILTFAKILHCFGCSILKILILKISENFLGICLMIWLKIAEVQLQLVKRKKEIWGVLVITQIVLNSATIDPMSMPKTVIFVKFPDLFNMYKY